jgi:Domain of unknown function (DUF5122) beta-propeller
MYLRSALTAATTAVLLVISAAAGNAAVVSSTAGSSSHADDGTVYTSVQVGSRLFVGGSFTRVDGTSRLRLAALDAATGKLDTSFRVDVDGEVRALATNGTTLFVGGKFTKVGGVSRKNLAAVNASTGAVTSFNPAPAGLVRGIGYSGGRVFFGGSFTQVGATAVRYLAAADAATGALYRAFPVADGPVYVVKAAGSNIWVGGNFAHIGTSGRSKVAVLSSTGSLLGYRASPGGPVDDIAVDPAGVFLAVAGGLPSGNSVYKTTSTGAKVWQVATDGNVQAVAVMGGTVYVGGHFGVICRTTTSGCGNTLTARKAFVADAGGSVPNARAWATFNSALGVWDLTVAGTNLYALGVFTTVNGRSAPRIARFQG